MTKKLYRSRKDRWVAGVCAGLAEYFGIDPIIVRIVVLLLILSAGAGLLAYIIAWLVVPEEPQEPAADEPGTGGQEA
jgi:phage shock protein PspC (stress-responsive transcriptional regulator)